MHLLIAVVYVLPPQLISGYRHDVTKCQLQRDATNLLSKVAQHTAAGTLPLITHRHLHVCEVQKEQPEVNCHFILPPELHNNKLAS